MPHKKRTASGVLGGLLGLVGLSTVAGILVTATVTPAIAVSGYAASNAISMFDNMPSYLEIDDLMEATEIYATVNDQPQLLARFYDQNRVPLEFDQISPLVYDAVLSSEDKNFYRHGGVDLAGTMSAVLANVRGTSSRGGSSISQQYVKNILVQRCEEDAASDEERDACYWEATNSDVSEGGLQRKLQEMRYAIQLEKSYTKDEILLGYLNIVNFGGQNYGIGAAAKYYFGVDAANLSLSQAATLAGMVQEPNGYRIDRPDSETNGEANGYAKTLNRRDYVLDRMLADGKITKEEHAAASAEPITPNITPTDQGCQMAGGSAYFCDLVRTTVENDPVFGETPDERKQNLRRGGYRIYTTLDLGLQIPAEEAISIVPATMEGIELGSTGVQIEVGTGRVLSMVQNTRYSQSAAQLEADRSFSSINFNTRKANGGSNGFNVGSTYKVFTLLDWLEKGHSINEVLNGRVRTFNIDRGCGQGVQPVDGVRIGNFEDSRGYTATPFQFTADSLNSGFFAMAEKLTVCDVNKVADRLGVTLADGHKTYEADASYPDLNAPYSILGSMNIAPIDMAGVYATIASGGIYCQPKVIDRITNSKGEELPLPETTCSRVLDESVANTAAYVLQNVLANGSATPSRTFDGVPLIGKTGIHQQFQTWMIGSSTKVASAVWVGNVIGESELNRLWANGYPLWRMRHAIWPELQRAANAKYGGDQFPGPDANLSRRVYADLPNVVGLTVEQATDVIQDAGFSVIVGDPVDGVEPAGTVTVQDPGPGRVPGGTTVTIRPSNGQGIAVPTVAGMSADKARDALRSAGFTAITPCPAPTPPGDDDDDEDARPPSQPKVTGTDPAAGTVTGRSAQITLICG
ncbi:transglycosylase domain-containing protein [Microbacterium sp. zg.Y1090]|uniref:transglycosylase domain-containing protein n=1 Tax=Microbacterium TaxID=33882 RepID=UPI00214BB7E0|nr:MULTISPECIES: transglycosylase domain-containing protein [unclassified Microbacterium]MCR2812755.1 transglycosylase domain-containing protein [Microbacterium sp. zg.Y1084]MCR2817451.1 transglycosylase domain-containing protein [Microbacterium sp. zg.Y1090]WIM29065.1 transglycosylase domain-containing protein [Microbacterium sp. zg-Y1090]